LFTDFFEDFSTSKTSKLISNNNNNNNNEDKSCGNGIINGMTVTSSVTTATVDGLKMADHLTVCSSPPASANSVTSSSPSDELAAVSSHAMSLQIATSEGATLDDEEDDEYACDTPTSLSPSRDAVGVTSSEKTIHPGSVPSTSLASTPRRGNGLTTASTTSSRHTSPMSIFGSQSSMAAAVAARCPPVREAVDPAKYITLTGEVDGVKYACSKCGNVYKWRKSLNKHWKEKHDGETPDPPGSVSPAARLAVATGHQNQLHHGHGLGLHRNTSPSDILGKHPSAAMSAFGNGRSMNVGRNSTMKISPEDIGSTPVVGGAFRQPAKGSLAALNPSLFGKFTLNPKSANRINPQHHHGQPQHHHHHHHHSQQQQRQSQSPLDVASGAAAWIFRQSGVDTMLKSPASSSINSISTSGGLKSADYFRSSYGATSPMDGLAAMSSSGRAEKPVDLSESSRPYRPSQTTISEMAETGSDPGVLDLSKKYTENGSGRWPAGQSSVDDYLAVQDEPLDFSTKVVAASRSPTTNGLVSGVPARASTAAGQQHIILPPAKFPLLDNVSPMSSSIAHHSVVGIPSAPVVSGDQHSDGAVLRCNQCPMKFSSQAKLSRHLSRDHAGLLMTPEGVDHRRQPLGCGTGSAQLYRYLTADSSLAVPVPAHHGAATGSNTTSCPICGKWFSSQLAVARHCDEDHPIMGHQNTLRQQIAHGSTAHRLDIDEPPCKKPMINLDGRKSHIQSESSGSVIQTNDDIKADMLFAHCDDEQTAIVIPQAPEEASSMTSTSNSKMIAASVAQHRPQSGSSKVGSGSVGRSRRAELLGFVASGSSSSGGGGAAAAEALLPFKCQLCEYRARWPSEMTQHAKNHSDEKPFRCPQCSYRSKWKWDVVKHLKRCGGGNCTASDVIDMSATLGRGPSNSTVATTKATPTQIHHQQQQNFETSNSFKAHKGNAQRRRRFQTVLISPAVIQHQFQQQQQSSQPAEDLVKQELRNGSTTSVVNDDSVSSEHHVTQAAVWNVPQTMVVTNSDVTESLMTDSNNEYTLSTDTLTFNDTSSAVVKLEQFVDEKVSMTSNDDDESQKTIQALTTTSSPVNVAHTGDSSTANDSSLASGSLAQGLHYCVQCPFVGHSPAELRRHQRVHSDEKPYSCRTCSYSSKWKCDLKKHLRAYNHVSAVPLVYGGHGRKPSLPADWSFGQMGLTDPRDLVGLVRDSDFFDQPPVFDAASATDYDRVARGQRHSGSGSGLAAGITTGGRLRCRRCDFEAVDITSFLQHKSQQHGGCQTSGYVGSKSVDRGEFTIPVASAATESTPLTSPFPFRSTPGQHHHRRKSSKQIRVLPQSGDTGDLSVPDVDQAMVCLVTRASSDAGKNAIEEERFWTSLGLKSRNKIDQPANNRHQLMQSSAVDEAMTVEGDSSWNVGSSLPSGFSVASAPSPGGSSGELDDNGSMMSESTSGTYETDVEYAEVDDVTKAMGLSATDEGGDSWGEPVDLCSRPIARTDDDAKEKEGNTPIFDLSHQLLQHQQHRLDSNSTTMPSAPVRRHWSWSKGIEGCSWRTSLNGTSRQSSVASDADELAAQSRRKRKLRTCDKCGYITDNLTTLQRHTAKHGSTGEISPVNFHFSCIYCKFNFYLGVCHYL